MGRPKGRTIDIRNQLIKLESEGREPRNSTTTGVPDSTYRSFKQARGSRRSSPTVAHLLGLAGHFRAPIDQLLADEADLHHEHAGLSWRLASSLAGTRERALQLAGLGAVLGESPGTIAEDLERFYSKQDAVAPSLEVDDLRSMIRGALALGLVQPAQPGVPRGMVDGELSARLAKALDLGPVSTGKGARVQVVPCIAHRDFGLDPVAPYLVGRVAHRVVGDFLEAHQKAYYLGIAGGQMVGTFVRSVSGASSPFPAGVANRRYIMLPLTLEPFEDHRFGLADSLVGEFARRTTSLLGPGLVTAPTFTPAAGDGPDGTHSDSFSFSVARVHPHYSDLDVAIFGCGNQRDGGWISRTLADRKLTLDPEPVTDVCLNLLSREGTPIDLPSKEGSVGFMGVGIRQIELVASNPNRLALLLTHGRDKGRAATVVFKARCANAVVCDQDAARAALKALDGTDAS